MTVRRIPALAILGLLGMSLLIVALMPMALRAQRGDSPVPGIDIAEQQAALARARTQAEDARKRSEALEARSQDSRAAADRTRNQIAAIASRIQQSEADQRAGEARIAIIAARQRAQAQRLAARQRPIVRLTAALQQIARRSPMLSLVAPGTVSDAVHRRIVLARMLPIITASTQGLRDDVARSADLRKSAEAATQALARTRDGLATQQKTLAIFEQRQRVESQTLRASASLETERSLAMGEQVRDIGELMARIETSAVIRDALLQLPGPTLRPAQPSRAPLPSEQARNAGATSGAAPPAYRLPVVGDVVAGFGEVSEGGVRARGLTIVTGASATVVAPAAGRVAFAGPFRGYGRIVIIEHGGSWTSLIANLDRLSAQVGDRLRQGDPIGATGPGKPQLIVELRRQEQPVDIAALLR